MNPRSRHAPGTPEAAQAPSGAGDGRAALDAFFSATEPALFRAAVTLTGDAATAEDALQETYLAALASARTFEEGRRVLPWLFGILRHKAAHARRHARRAAGRGAVPDAARDAEGLARLARDEDEASARLALESLSEPYRSVALLRWRYGLTPAQIAHVRGEPPGTVWSLLSRALSRLRKTLRCLPAVLLGRPPRRGLDSVRGAVEANAVETGATAGSLAVAGALAIGLAASGLVALGRADPRSTDGPPAAERAVASETGYRQAAAQVLGGEEALERASLARARIAEARACVDDARRARDRASVGSSSRAPAPGQPAPSRRRDAAGQPGSGPETPAAVPIP